MEIKAEIIKLAKEIGISKIGFTTADDFSYLEKSLRLGVEEGRTSGFEHKNIEERVKPKLSLASAKTIISIAVAYPHKLPVPPPKTAYKRGKITPNSWGTDYHHVLQDKLSQLAQGIEALTKDFEYKGMVDTGALVDTAVARRAGIGFIGKNGLVISKEFGSYMYLGELITNLDITPDQPVTYDCGDCRRCLDACPTSCLIGDGTMNAKECLSFQTQDKGMMDLKFRKKIKTVIYGCDICQICCPYNKGLSNPLASDIDPELAMPELIPFLELSNKDFKEKFGYIAASWRGKNILQRNAIIALANGHDKSAIIKLMQIIDKNNNPIHTAPAIWALGQVIKTPEEPMIAFIRSIKPSDKDSQKELELLLAKWQL
ncbi:tRNA epoxyqueuosine(34) reductase QueG [Streptococcus iniae]|uniref:tRNA epoxyqueuosine(34) reductase QueG n=1 Tax=Streptococcus iniae TaxID=1346 RepID=UPI000EF72F68|nr:tRNA epoxyqueuosine(34) reductase QueG [Streptococcus iniae]RLU50601.1 tRNA epoxyqueuosine(34) reductase QueG [Streptococcus iniae]RLU74674.1 tRNA epoxyqueuosine(34) reductase QueG [Streptococcus iniae]RLV02349.1 tRNA epoxyqueuosine(34) reductase QueG [Streptococcus iniae]RLV18461.1 tRNA epoxyqueuosine(34) reductase QueG [Streptococcus iniae]RLV23686.1 tRNA epoxyqueuosine(34) reductase QueG [Streptococcus iniae]